MLRLGPAAYGPAQRDLGREHTRAAIDAAKWHSRPPMVTPATAPPRFAALRIPAYRRYFTFSLMSMMADNIEHVISYWVMFQVFHSAALGGFAVISHWVPFLLFSMYTGALADRHDCWRLIQISQGLFMLASLSWAVLFLAGKLQMWHAVILLTIHGM